MRTRKDHAVSDIIIDFIDSDEFIVILRENRKEKQVSSKIEHPD